MVVYVDDFKLSGPASNLAEGWSLIRKHIKTDEPHQIGLFLGCQHTVFERFLPDSKYPVRGVEYDMEDFLRSCVDRYREITGVTTMRRAATPFLPEPTRPDFSTTGAVPTDEDVDDALRKLQDVIDGTTTDVGQGGTATDDENVPQQLAPYAAKVLMKVLYAARFARFDLLRAVCVLAQQVSKWNRECDTKLYRLMCYINGTFHVRMTGWIGDAIEDVTLHLFADADFAGCSKTSRSTSGAHLTLLGSRSTWPLAGQSKKQGCVSHSTPEAEIVAADHAVRTMGVPSLDLWSTLFERPEANVVFHEDNETAIIVMRQGHSPTMRHLERTHGVCLRWLAERFQCPDYQIMYERSVLQAADIYTKAFTSLAEWVRNLRLINHLDPKLFWSGRSDGARSEMLTEHKGGVVFDYWTHNPWYEQPVVGPTSAAAPATNVTCHPTYDDNRHFDDIVPMYDLDFYATTRDDDTHDELDPS